MGLFGTNPNQSAPERCARWLGFGPNINLAREIAGLARTAFGSADSRRNAFRLRLPGETFDEMAWRLGISNEEVQARCRNKALLCEVALATFAAIFVLAIGYAVSASSLLDSAVTFATFALAVAIGSKAFAASYECAQLRERRFVGVREFLRTPVMWIPLRSSVGDVVPASVRTPAETERWLRQ